MGKKGRPARLGALALLIASFPALAQEAPGFDASRRVRMATSLDWEFVAAGAKLPGTHDSRRQRYQLFQPAAYAKSKSWPLLLWLPPGDAPNGWKAVGGLCIDQGVFFASPYGAGGGRPEAVRLRAALDVLDDVRKTYRIDPARTYLIGSGESASLACKLATHLPELFGGVAALDSDGLVPKLDYLRHRMKARLSFAFLATDESIKAQVERYSGGLYRDLGVRARVFGGKQDEKAFTPLIQWLEDGKAARDADARVWRIAGKPEADNRELAQHALELARQWKADTARQYLAAATLEWLTLRHGKTEGGREALKELEAWRADPRAGKRLAEMLAADRRPIVRAQARAEERRGKLEEAYLLWEEAARLAYNPEDRDRANKEVDRLGDRLRLIPYLGLAFEGETTVVRSVAPGGPADRAGLLPGDRLVRMGDLEVRGVEMARKGLEALRPGVLVEAAWVREGKPMKRGLQVGSRLEALRDKAPR